LGKRFLSFALNLKMRKMKTLLFSSSIIAMLVIAVVKIQTKKSHKIKEPVAKSFSSAAYDSVKKSVASVKQKATQTDLQKKAFLSFVYKKIIPYWYNTQWDFNGTTETPGEGKIACGYFVTTILRDAGVKLERSKLACAASEEMIKQLTSKEYIKRYSNYKLDKFCKEVKKFGEGVFVVGLDSHTGLLVNSNDSLFFIHSNGYGWHDLKVIKENAFESEVLEDSGYKVVGYLTNDKNFLKNWAAYQSQK
jgi:hypothetical protein